MVRIAFADRITHLAANRFPEASVESLHEDDENHGLRFIAATIGILIAIGLLAYPALDSSGYIPHLVETSITAQSNWFVGESKDCVSRPLDEKSANLMHKDVGDVTTAIRCDDGPERRVQVQFFGKLIQTENVLAMWRCTRKEDSFQCNQTAAIPSPH